MSRAAGALGPAFLVLLGSLVPTSPLFAQIDPAEEPVDPSAADPDVNLEILVRGVASVNGTIDRAGNVGAVLDFSDTLFTLRPRVALFDRTVRAGIAFTVTFPDVYDRPGTPLVADANVFLDSQWLGVRVGRSRIRSRIVPMPTLRDDDLIRYSDVQNPFSNGTSTADHQFGNVAEVAVWIDPRWYGELHVENLANDILDPQSLASFSINSYGLNLGYREISALQRISPVRSIGVGANAYWVDVARQQWMIEVLAGGWFNLSQDPVHGLELRAQGIYSPGVAGTGLTTMTDSFRANAISGAAALQYVWRERLRPTLRIAVIGGYRRYFDFGLHQWSVAGNIFYSLGWGFEVGVQYQAHLGDAAIPSAFGDAFEHTLKIALIGTLDTIIGARFEERDSLLNAESGWLP